MANTFYSAFDWERFEPGYGVTGDTRMPFEIDRDRIIHSSAFRRLQSKTQVFLSGEYDFYRTRLTHSIEVAQIGRSICLHLQRTSDLLGDDYHVDSDLVEAICLAHDLGHPPFGHAGERTLNALMQPYGGFEGNAQTLRLLTSIIYQGNRGQNPTRAYLDGVLKYKSPRAQVMALTGVPPHNHFLYDDQQKVLDFVTGNREFPADLVPGNVRNRFRSLECQIMDWADDTAYSIHDVVDGIHAGFLDGPRIERWAAARNFKDDDAATVERLVKAIHAGKAEPRMERRIGDFIRACTLREVHNFLSPHSNRHRYALDIEPGVAAECKVYKALAFDCVFLTHQLKQLEFKGERMLSELFQIFSGQYLEAEKPRFNLLPPEVAALLDTEQNVAGRARRLCDYLAGMTDGFATRTCKRLTDPDFGSIVDLV